MSTRILIIDDNNELRQLVKNYLISQELDLEIFEACTGEMGVAKTSFIKPDIVIMDINLPQANGIESAKIIKQDFPSCAVIILTMFDVKVFRKAAMALDVAAFVGKSEIYEKLLPAVRRCITARKSIRKTPVA